MVKGKATGPQTEKKVEGTGSQSPSTAVQRDDEDVRLRNAYDAVRVRLQEEGDRIICLTESWPELTNAQAAGMDMQALVRQMQQHEEQLSKTRVALAQLRDLLP